MELDTILARLNIDYLNYKTIMYTDEGDYYNLSLETEDGVCFAIDVSKEQLS